MKKIINETTLNKKHKTVFSGSAKETKEVYPVLNPKRKEKRQNGRRMKGNGEPSFTLTSMDKHGVYIRKIHEITGGRNQAQRVYLPIISTTISALGGGQGAKTGLYMLDEKIRRLTPKECERLQGFRDDFTMGFSDSVRYRLLGNAVTTNVAAEVMKGLLYEQ
jgi:DNA (cytosine-5)-methyltransferase 1